MLSIGLTLVAGPVGCATESTPRRTGLWAVLLAASSGPANTRHQADVVAQHAVLRANGVRADRIIVISEGELAVPLRYVTDEPPITTPLQVDYRLQDVGAAEVAAIVAGRAGPRTPLVVDAGPGDDIYLFVAGHGDRSGLGIGSGAADAADGADVLTPQMLLKAVRGRAAYRSVLLAVEACNAATFDAVAAAPRTAVLSAAAVDEKDHAAARDEVTGAFLADDFALELWRASRNPGDRDVAATARIVADEVGLSTVAVAGAREVTGSPLSSYLSP